MASFTERLLVIIDADSKGAARGFDQVSDSAKKADKSFDDLGRKSSRLGDSLKSGIALGAGAIIGGGLADAVLGVGKAYLDAATGVEQFANSTNATIEQSSQFMGMAQSLGLDLNDLLEITAEFQTKAAGMRDELADVGIELQKNADGTLNLSESLVDALEGLQAIPDDAQRSELAFKLFGEEGAKQLSAIYNGSRDVRDAMEELDLGIDQGDIEKAKNFNLAMMDLKSAGRDVGFTLASSILPAITALVEALGPLADALGAIPPELLLIGGSLLAFQKFGPGIGAVGGAVRTAADNFRYLSQFTQLGGQQIGAMGAATMTFKEGLKGLGGSIMSALGGPVGATIIGTGVAYTLASQAVEKFKAKAQEMIPVYSELTDAGMSHNEALDETARRMAEQLSLVEQVGAEIQGTPGGIVGFFNPIVGGYDAISDAVTGTDSALEESKKELQEQVEALGQSAVAAQQMAQKQLDLNNLIAENASLNGGAFQQAVRDAATAQAEQKAQTDLATAAIDAYTASTTGAVDATLAAASSTYASNDAYRAAQTAIQEAATTVDDGATAANEAAASQDEAASAALRFAAASLTAAQEQAALRGEVLSAGAAADAQIAALQLLAQQPGISETTKANIQGLITDLETAKAKGDEGVNVQVGETGAAATGEEIDQTAEDRDSTVQISSRGGPAVISYLDRVAADRQALVRVESRNGPAVISYLNRIAEQRLALIRVESRNGPAVISYLDSIAHERLAIIRVESRNGPAVDSYLDSLASQSRTARIAVQQNAAPTAAAGVQAVGLMAATNPVGAVAAVYPLAATRGAATTVVRNTYQITNEVAAGANPVEVGRVTVAAIRAFERSAGANWRASP